MTLLQKNQNWLRVGKVKDAQGLRGDLFIHVFAKESPWADRLQSFALASDDAGPFEEFKVEKSQPHKEGLKIKAQELSDRTQAEAKRGLLFYISPELMVSQKGESIYLREIHGFLVRTEKEVVGTIEDFSSNGAQDLLVVRRNETQLVEIPFVEAFICKVDFQDKQVIMDLPEGLWEDE